MSKTMTTLGFMSTEENPDEPGKWRPIITEKPFYADVNKCSRRISNGEGTIDKVSISSTLSIVADPYADDDFMSIEYATYLGHKWKVDDVTVEYPRLTLTLGGLYNGPTASTS